MSTKTKAAREEKKKKATYCLTAEQLDNMETEIANQSRAEAFVVMLGLSVMTINDHFGQLVACQDTKGVKRPERFTDYMFELWDEFNDGRISLQDCIDVLKEECGIDIVQDAKKRKVI